MSIIIAGLQPQCPYCETLLTLSVELIECLEKDTAPDEEFDRAIFEAIQKMNGKDKSIRMKDVPFFIWLADNPPAIGIAGWCPKCRRVSAPLLPLAEVLDQIQKARE